MVLLSVFLLIGLHREAIADELSLPYPGSEFYRQFGDLDVDQRMVAARAVNSSVNGACLRDNLAPAVDLTIGGASSGPRALNQYHCLVYGFTVQPDDLGGDDIVFTITSPSSPTPSYTTWRFYREETTLARNDNTFDLTSTLFICPLLWVHEITDRHGRCGLELCDAQLHGQAHQEVDLHADLDRDLPREPGHGLRYVRQDRERR
jgi:hypothetical protein